MNITSKDHANRTCTLVYVKGGKPVPMDDIVTLRDGQRVKITGGRAPHKPGSTGRVWVQDLANGAETEFFPGVVDAQWMPEAKPQDDAPDTRFMPLEP